MNIFSYPHPSSLLSAILVSLIETRKCSIELCHSKKKNLIMIVQPSCMMCKRGKEKKKEVVVLFFSSIVVKWKCFLPGISLFLYYYVFALSLARFFRARQLRMMKTFISILSYIQTSCAKRLIYFVHCLICSVIQAPGDISFYRRGITTNFLRFY